MSSSYRPVVAIAGLGGVLGQATLDALLSPQFASSFQLPIRVLMRDPSRFGGPVHSAGMAAYLGVDYEDPEVLDDALENVDVVINLLGMYPRSWISLGDAAYRCGAKLYIPSEFGPDHRMFTFPSPLSAKQEQSQRSREDGIKTVQIFCGMLMDYVIPSGSWFGVDLPNRHIDAVVPGGGRAEPKISFTSIGDVAMAIASVARRRPSTLPDVIHIAGDTCTLRQLGEHWQTITRSRVHIATTDLASFRQGVLERGSSNLALYYRLAAGEGLLNYGSSNANAWLSTGVQWQWKSIQQQIAGN
ncbi:uncharacterized protein H6S33_005936 [Morchella sextelata]|uniref:uncharacterized protein n=1 Tax=Morchella sextelata TaxID=1174677 RepID=UPI001D049BE1|nr:uncharacterized protein H6S33_005936 [Morchella sextelata]KAH0614050.1 hypothetical protein H6S33_005936 [Morchella sextelata]